MPAPLPARLLPCPLHWPAEAALCGLRPRLTSSGLYLVFYGGQGWAPTRSCVPQIFSAFQPHARPKLPCVPPFGFPSPLTPHHAQAKGGAWDTILRASNGDQAEEFPS